MDIAAFIALALACAPQVHPDTARAIVVVESAFNPYAIGVVGGVLERQPRTRAEALATAKELDARRWNYSVGLGQINVSNFGRLGLNAEAAFDPCTNLGALQAVLCDCYQRAPAAAEQRSLRQALSCYYSGNFNTGVRHGYVDRVVIAAVPPGSSPSAPRRSRSSSSQESLQ